MTGKKIVLERKEMVRWSRGEDENEERGAVKMEKKMELIEWQWWWTKKRIVQPFTNNSAALLTAPASLLTWQE